VKKKGVAGLFFLVDCLELARQYAEEAKSEKNTKNPNLSTQTRDQPSRGERKTRRNTGKEWRELRA